MNFLGTVFTLIFVELAIKVMQKSTEKNTVASNQNSYIVKYDKELTNILLMCSAILAALGIFFLIMALNGVKDELGQSTYGHVILFAIMFVITFIAYIDYTGVFIVVQNDTITIHKIFSKKSYNINQITCVEKSKQRKYDVKKVHTLYFGNKKLVTMELIYCSNSETFLNMLEQYNRIIRQ